MWLPLGEEYRVSMVGRGETPCFFCRGVEPWIFNSWVRLDVPLKFAGKICRKTQKIWVWFMQKLWFPVKIFFPSAPLKVRQEAMIMHKKWSSMPAIQLNIYIFARMSGISCLEDHSTSGLAGFYRWLRESYKHTYAIHSMYCCWRVERPPITFGNKSVWVKTYCGWLQKPAPFDWWQTSHYFEWVSTIQVVQDFFFHPQYQNLFLVLSMKYP